MAKRGNWYTIFLIGILLVCVVLLIVENLHSITGYVTQGSTTSNVSIQNYFATMMSTNLTAGIDFGNVYSTNYLDQNATKNWCHPTNGTCTNISSAAVFNATYYYLNVSADSNTDVDFCIRANEALKVNGGVDVIGLGNETYTYTNVSNTNLTSPPQQGQAALTASYVKASYDIPKGNSTFYRFFLDIPNAQAAGNYNNTILFEGVQNSVAC